MRLFCACCKRLYRRELEAHVEAEIAYENYLKSDDKTINIEGTLYYRPISLSLSLSHILGRPVAQLVLPREMFEGRGPVRVLRSDTGKAYELRGTDHFSFRGEVPEGYRRGLVFTVEIGKGEEMGSYFALVEAEG
jgi:hypothetical protein